MLPRALKDEFTAAVSRMLRTVVRHLIAQGVTYPALTQMLKELYLDVAESEFALPFKRQTDSRLALVTGLNRKEIAALRRRRAPLTAAVALEQSLSAHVIGRWMAGPPYADRDGTPRHLPYESMRTSVASFARLVRDLSVDIPVRSVLDELLRSGVVALRRDGDVELLREAHMPTTDVAAKLALLGTDPVEASVVGEIRTRRDFYDYEAKYVDEDTELLVPAPLEPERARRAQELAIAQSTVSQHLLILREAGVLRADADGPRRWYRLEPEPVARVRAYLAAFKDQS